MAKSPKKETLTKIQESSTALGVFTMQRKQIAKGLEIIQAAGLDKDSAAHLLNDLNNSLTMHNAEIEYLRKNLIYNFGKLSSEMTDEKFSKFAEVIRDYLIPQNASAETLPATGK